jgi:hypothetical protein
VQSKVSRIAPSIWALILGAVGGIVASMSSAHVSKCSTNVQRIDGDLAAWSVAYSAYLGEGGNGDLALGYTYVLRDFYEPLEKAIIKADYNPTTVPQDASETEKDAAREKLPSVRELTEVTFKKHYVHKPKDAKTLSTGEFENQVKEGKQYVEYFDRLNPIEKLNPQLRAIAGLQATVKAVRGIPNETRTALDSSLANEVAGIINYAQAIAGYRNFAGAQKAGEAEGYFKLNDALTAKYKGFVDARKATQDELTKQDVPGQMRTSRDKESC